MCPPVVGITNSLNMSGNCVVFAVDGPMGLPPGFHRNSACVTC